ncbi:unnamed protein product [Cercospora beticola]|nr:unnamed protein product [Cercospora beticola]
MCECRSGRILNGLNGSSQTVAARVPDSRLVLSTATCNQSAILCGRLVRCAEGGSGCEVRKAGLADVSFSPPNVCFQRPPGSSLLCLTRVETPVARSGTA